MVGKEGKKEERGGCGAVESNEGPPCSRARQQIRAGQVHGTLSLGIRTDSTLLWHRFSHDTLLRDQNM
jgi:hypothetical protein